jgi:organic radical activating enzyme
MDQLKRLNQHAANIIITHKCNKNCKWCCDTLVHSSDEIISLNKTNRFIFDSYQEGCKTIMLLGGEPLMGGISLIKSICNKIHYFGMTVSLTTNGTIDYQDLDGYVDYLNISTTKNVGKMKNTFLARNIVIDKNFAKSAEEAYNKVMREQECFTRFSSLSLSTTPRKFFDDWQPKWFDEFYSMFDTIPIYETSTGAYIPNGIIKFLHKSKTVARHKILEPNGTILPHFEEFTKELI